MVPDPSVEMNELTPMRTMKKPLMAPTAVAITRPARTAKYGCQP